MANKSKLQAIRGTRDLLPPETALWNRVEATAREIFGTFGFGEIRPPIFEQAELFARAVGGETDVVSKEMYTFEDRPYGVDEATRRYLVEERRVLDFDLLTLRPEATASVCRAYIQHNMQQHLQPVKLYYMGPMFRHERPQKGRYRQFYQIGAEVLEAIRPDAKQGMMSTFSTRHPTEAVLRDAVIDAEVLEMVITFFDRLQLPGAQLEINSIGHNGPDCRRRYVGALYNELIKIKDHLGPDSQQRIGTNPLRVLDSKVESEQPFIEKLPRVVEHLCPDCAAHYAALKRQLELRGVIYKENWRLVRGLDYYMRTTFEITAQGLGSQNAVCGGGRYDGLVELLGGPPTKGIGFAIGEDRLILSLQTAQHESRVTSHEPLSVYIAWMGERAYATAIRAAKDLRNAGFSVELPPVEQKFGKALERASKLGSRYALILGDNEVAEGSWTLKTLADGSQQKLTEPELLEFLSGHK